MALPGSVRAGNRTSRGQLGLVCPGRCVPRTAPAPNDTRELRLRLGSLRGDGRRSGQRPHGVTGSSRRSGLDGHDRHSLVPDSRVIRRPDNRSDGVPFVHAPAVGAARGQNPLCCRRRESRPSGEAGARAIRGTGLLVDQKRCPVLSVFSRVVQVVAVVVVTGLAVVGVVGLINDEPPIQTASASSDVVQVCPATGCSATSCHAAAPSAPAPGTASREADGQTLPTPRYANGEADGGNGVLVCPATGCATTSCHATQGSAGGRRDDDDSW